jgi:hypothetical protein
MYTLGRNVNIWFTGHRLEKALEGLSKPQRAVLVADLRVRGVALTELSQAQWAALAEVNAGYISKATQLSSDEREAVYLGRRPLVETNGHSIPDIATVIAVHGAEVVAAAALDAMPAVKAAAE